MPPTLVHLPNGQTLNVTPVFGGLFFKANDLNTHHNVFPPGWTIILNSEDDDTDHKSVEAVPDSKPMDSKATDLAAPEGKLMEEAAFPEKALPKKHHIHRYKKPTLRNDHMFISSISNPASNEFRPATSPTRQIAMMLWATLYWYFHQEEPVQQITTAASEKTPDDGKPKGEWHININREGIFKGKHLLPKLERMGLIATEDSTVGLEPEEGLTNTGEGWTRMFVSRRSFWQLDPRIYLFTLTPLQTNSPYPSLSPAGSRPASPNRTSRIHDEPTSLGIQATTQNAVLTNRASTPPGPFHSSSHLPTFYPPPPAQYTFTNHIRHPIRHKPPRQGETFYTRYVPSLEQYLSFRVASLSKRPIVYNGPFSQHAGGEPTLASAREILRTANSHSDPQTPTLNNLNLSSSSETDTTRMTDTELLRKWMNDPRVSYSWGEQGDLAHQEQFLKNAMTSKHSMPVIGCFDGKPFGFFEIYWVKEDRLSMFLGGDCGDWDRGLHVLVGEQEFRGAHRVKVWLSALVHYCWTADQRTERVVMEPRVDNLKLKKYCEEQGFYREKELSMPHKQANLMKIRRESWEAPAI